MFDQDDEQPAERREPERDRTVIALVDLSGIYWMHWHSGGADQPADAPARATVEKVRKLATRYKHLAICCDVARTWRHDHSKDYKANRQQKPEEARAQLKRAVQILKADGFPIWIADGYEADDVIASACEWAREQKHDVVIVSADKDLLQLVGDGVSVESTRWDDKIEGFPRLGPVEVEKKLGVPPRQVADFLALVGDKSDNVPGVPKVGEVTAAKLLASFSDVHGVLSAAREDNDAITPAIRKAILDNQEQLATSLILVSLKTDVKLDWSEVLKPRVTKKLPSQNAAPPPKEEQEMGDVAEGEFEETEKPKTNAKPSDPGTNQGPPPPDDKAKTAQAPASNGNIPTPTAMIQRLDPRSDEWAMALEPGGINGAWWLAEKVVNSRLFGQFPNEEAALCAIIRGRELGVPALTALALTHVIEGKLAMHAMLIIGLAIKSKKCDVFKLIHTSATKAVWRVHRRDDPDPQTLDIEFTFEMAEKAGYTYVGQGKRPGNWQKIPHTMLRWRAGVEAARVIVPEVVGGLYMPEELGGETVVTAEEMAA